MGEGLSREKGGREERNWRECRFHLKELCSNWGGARGRCGLRVFCVLLFFQLGEITSCFYADGNNPVERAILMVREREGEHCWRDQPSLSPLQANRSCPL